MNTLNYINSSTKLNQVIHRSEMQDDILEKVSVWLDKAHYSREHLPLPGPLGDEGFRARLTGAYSACFLNCDVFHVNFKTLTDFGITINEALSNANWQLMTYDSESLTIPAVPWCIGQQGKNSINRPDLVYLAKEFELNLAWAFIERSKCIITKN